MPIVLRKTTTSVFGALKWAGAGNKVILLSPGSVDAHTRWKNVGWIVLLFGAGGGFKGTGWYGWNGVFILEEDGATVGNPAVVTAVEAEVSSDAGLLSFAMPPLPEVTALTTISRHFVRTSQWRMCERNSR